MYEIRIKIDTRTADELKPLYEESNRLLAATGYEQWTFEHWYETMLMLGGTPRIRANAKLLNKQTPNHLNELKNNNETE